MDGDDRTGLWVITWLHVRGWRPGPMTGGPPKYPSMPRAQWRRWALRCAAVGAVIGAVLGRRDLALAVASAIVVGLLAVAVGMYAIESIWLRGRTER